MRILSVIASLAESGGTEMLVRNLSRDFAARGHHCHIAYLSDAASLNVPAAYERRFMAEMDTAGVGYSRLGHDVRRNWFAGGGRLRGVVRTFRPDVLHVHLGYGLLLQAAGVLRLPTVYTHHNSVLKFPPALFRLFDLFVDRYVAIGAACRALLTGNVRRPIVDIPNGVPATFTRGSPRVEPRRDPRLLAVGNLTPQKNYPLLIDMMRRLAPALAAEGRRVTLDIAGEGPERGRIATMIAAAGLTGTVRLLGARSDVPDLMADADLLVLGSRYEGLPITLIEAAASGLPAVATDVGGSGEVVVHGTTGSLVPSGEPDAMTAAVRLLLADPASYAACSIASTRQAQRFGLAACADAYLSLYAEIAA